MIDEVLIGLAAAAGIVLLGRLLDMLLRGRPGRWIAPEAWVFLLILWSSRAAGQVAADYENALLMDVGASSTSLREAAVMGGVPLIVLAALVVATRYRLIWERRRVLIVMALAALGAVGLLSAGIGAVNGNNNGYLVADTWRWAILPLYGLLMAGEERPRAWPVALAAGVVGIFSILEDAPGTIPDIGDNIKPGPVGTATVVLTAVALGWAAEARRWLAIPLGLLLTYELVVTGASASRTAAVLAGVAILLGLALSWRPRPLLRAVAAGGIPALILIVAIIQIDSVHDWAQPSLTRWKERSAQEVIPHDPTPDTPAPAPPEPAPDEQGSSNGAVTVIASLNAELALQSEPEPQPAPEPAPVSFSSVGERREEVERSRDWILRGGRPADVARAVFGEGQGAEFLAPQLPRLDTRGKPGYRHHIHLTYMSAVFRNGLLGLAALLFVLVALLVTSVRAVRQLPVAAWDNLAARVVLVYTIVVALEMVTGFVFLGSFEAGGLVAGGVALAVGLAESRRPEPSAPA